MVAAPPRHPPASTNPTRAPVRAAPTAAATPAEPPPTTSTSYCAALTFSRRSGRLSNPSEEAQFEWQNPTRTVSHVPRSNDEQPATRGSTLHHAGQHFETSNRPPSRFRFRLDHIFSIVGTKSARSRCATLASRICCRSDGPKRPNGLGRNPHAVQICADKIP
jgi:hypothetical protein